MAPCRQLAPKDRNYLWRHSILFITLRFQFVCYSASIFTTKAVGYRFDPVQQLATLSRSRVAKGHAFLVNGSLQGWSAQAGAAELRAIVNFKTSLKSLELSEPIIFIPVLKYRKQRKIYWDWICNPKNTSLVSYHWAIIYLKGHGNEADFLGFLQKSVPHESLTLHFEPFRFSLGIRGDIRNWKTTPRLAEPGSLQDCL